MHRRIVSSLAWAFAGSWTEQAFNFVIFVILARLLGPDAFGLAMMAMVFVIFAEFLVRETLTEPIIRMHDPDPGHLDAVFWLLILFSVLIFIALITCAPWIALLYSEPDVADFVRGGSATVLFIGFSAVPVVLLRRELRFRALALRATGGVVVGGVVGIAMALADFGAWALIGQRLAQVFVNSALAWIASPWLPRFRMSRRHTQDITGFGVNVVGLRVSELISVQTPTVVIGMVFGTNVLGQYTIAWRLVEVLSFLIVVPIRAVAQPALARYRTSGVQTQNLLQSFMEASATIGFASFVGLALVASIAVPLMFGSEWESAVPILQILCLVGIYFSIERVQQAFFLAMGSPKTLFILSSLESIFGIIAMVIAAWLNPLVVAAAFVFRYIFVWPLRFWFLNKEFGVELATYTRALLIPIGATIAMAVSVLVWQLLTDGLFSPVVAFGSSITIGAVVYIAFTYLQGKERIVRVIETLRFERNV